MQLRNLTTGRCMDLVGNGSWGNGNWIGHYDCHGGDNQKWWFDHRGKKNVCQRSNAWGSCVEWRAEDAYRISPVLTDKCADLDAKGTDSGTRVHQWTCLNDDSQLWYFRDTPRGRMIFSGGRRTSGVSPSPAPSSPAGTTPTRGKSGPRTTTNPPSRPGRPASEPL